MEDLLGTRQSEVVEAVDLPRKRPVSRPRLYRSLAGPPVEMVRLPAENLDRLVRSTGLILTESLRQESVTAELDALDGQIDRN